jgi:hypothetical protein
LLCSVHGQSKSKLPYGGQEIDKNQRTFIGGITKWKIAFFVDYFKEITRTYHILNEWVCCFLDRLFS